MPEPTAPRPDVPDDLLTLAADAIRRYDWDTGLSANPDVSKHQRREAAAVLAAVLPAHERRVREQVAAEIEAERSGGTEHWGIAMDHAARIARGES